MAKTDTLNIRINPEVKKQVEATLDDLGLNNGGSSKYIF